MRRTLLYTNYLIHCRLSTDPEIYDLGRLWMAWMSIIRNSIGCGQCLCPKMLSDIFSFKFTLLLPNWLLMVDIDQNLQRHRAVSLRQHGMAFLFYINIHPKPSNVYFFFSRFIRAPRHAIVGPIFALNTSYDVVLRKKVPFGGEKI